MVTLSISSVVSRISAFVLGIGGLLLLFAPDVLIPRLIGGFPTEGLWLAQLLGAAWLAVAALNWLQRSAVIGGIYGRPIVFANLILYFVGALVLVKAAVQTPAARPLWGMAAPLIMLTLVYGMLLLRGPFDGLSRRD